MVKYYISSNEWYPVFEARKAEKEDEGPLYEGDPGFELTEEELADLKRVMKEFNDWQMKLLKKANQSEDYFEERELIW